jgi:hypothetical protein
MASRTRSSSRSSGHKAQFFVLSAFVIIVILFVVSQFIQPAGILDSSSAVLIDEGFVYNNIRDKSIEVVKQTETCAELPLNLQEYKDFVQRFIAQRNVKVVYNFQVSQPCSESVMSTSFYLLIASPRASIDGSFTATKSTVS